MAFLDVKSGLAAVVRNLAQVFGAKVGSAMRHIVVDRYYTSVALAIQLYRMGY